MDQISTRVDPEWIKFRAAKVSLRGDPVRISVSSKVQFSNQSRSSVDQRFQAAPLNCTATPKASLRGNPDDSSEQSYLVS